MGQFAEFVNDISEVATKDNRACGNFKDARLTAFKEALKKARLVITNTTTYLC